MFLSTYIHNNLKYLLQVKINLCMIFYYYYYCLKLKSIKYKETKRRKERQIKTNEYRIFKQIAADLMDKRMVLLIEY